MDGALGARRGGTRGLVELIRRHGDAVEADLHEHYGVDLIDVFRGRVTWRKLGVLLRQLPSASRTREVLRDGPHWSIEAHLLDDLRMSMTGSKEHPAKRHPDRPTGKPRTRALSPERRARLDDAAERARARRAAREAN